MYSCVTVFTHARVLNETQALKHVVRESLHACMLHDRRALWELTHLFRVTHLFAASPTYLQHHPPICCVTHLFAASVAAGARVATAGQCSHSFWHLTLSVEGR